MADHSTDDALRALFQRTRVIAVVGISWKPQRASYRVAEFLQAKGYRIVPVNPGLVGNTLFGERIVPDLAHAPDDVDMIDIFRRPDAVPDVVDAALADIPNLQSIWMQLDITHPAAAAKAQRQGIQVIQDRCPKIEFPRLFGTASLADIRTNF